MTHQTKEMADE